jgi:hypothetical protein
MANTAELVADQETTEQGGLSLLLQDLTVESFEIPGEVFLDGDTFASDNEATCGLKCVKIDPGSFQPGCVWNDPSEVCW